MRPTIRVVTLTALAFATITCSDASVPSAPNQPGLVPGRAAVALAFSPQAAQAFAMIARTANPVTEVRVRLTAGSSTVLDTVFAVPAIPESARLDLPVRIQGAEQSLSAILDLRSADHSVLFTATQVIVARSADLPTSPAQLLTLNYSGPGSAAATLTLSAPDTTVQGTSVVTYAATARDAAGTPLADVLVIWTSSDTSVATVTPVGTRNVMLRTTGRRGATTLTASTPLGVAATVRVSVVPAPTHFILVSGAMQAGVAGSTLPQPLVVEARAADNLPVPGALVTFRAVTPGAGVVNVSTMTDAAGRASATMVLGKTAGAYQFEVSASGVPTISATASASASPPSAVTMVSGDGQVDSLGVALVPLVVKVIDQFGLPAEGQAVRWTIESGSGVLASATSTTDATGTASGTYTLGNRAGLDVITATVPGLTGPSAVVQFSARAIARGIAGVVIVSGGAQSAETRTTLPSPVVVLVKDALGNPMDGVAVAWSSTTGATASPATATTNAIGEASASIAFGATPGPVAITARAGTRDASTVMTIVQAAPASIAPYVGDGQGATVGTAVAQRPGVIVRDARGFEVLNTSVTFAVVNGRGTVSGSVSQTDHRGVALAGAWTLDTIAGPNSLTATTGAFTTTLTSTGTPAAATQIAINSAPATLVAGADAIFTFKVADRYGNAVPQFGLDMWLQYALPNGFGGSGPLTTNAQGIATFSIMPVNMAAGVVTFVVTSSGLLPTLTFTRSVVSGSPYSIWYTTFPPIRGVLGIPLPPTVVQLVDAGMNPSNAPGHAITFSIDSGGGTLTGTTTATTDAHGRATFADLVISGQPGIRRTNFRGPGLGSTTGHWISMTAGPPSQLVFVGDTSPSAVVGTAVASPPAVRVTDDAGNPVAFSTVHFTIMTDDDDGIARGQLAVGALAGTWVAMSTDESGVARLDRWTLTTRAGPSRVSAVSEFALPWKFITATALSGAGTRLTFTTTPSLDAISGVALVNQPALQLRDAHGNAVKIAGMTLTASITSGTGTLTGATATTDANGLATFAGFRIAGGPGNIVLGFSAPGYTTLTSGTITIR